MLLGQTDEVSKAREYLSICLLTNTRSSSKPKTGLTEVAATLDDFETEPGDLVSRLKRCSISDTSESSQKVEPHVRNSFDLKL